MTRDEDLKSAVMQSLHESGIRIDRPVSLVMMSAPLIGAGYSLDEIFDAVRALMDERRIEAVSGDRVRLSHRLH